MKETIYPLGADLAIRIKFGDIDGRPLDIAFCRWSIWLGTGTGGYVSVSYRDGNIESNGSIPASCDYGVGYVRVFAKSSAVSFGIGKLRARIKLSIPNANFEDGWQELVFKSMCCVSDGVYEVNTNITIVE